jgi:hypothetical protein
MIGSWEQWFWCGGNEVLLAMARLQRTDTLKRAQRTSYRSMKGGGRVELGAVIMVRRG